MRRFAASLCWVVFHVVGLGAAHADSVVFDFESQPLKVNVTTMVMEKDGLVATITRSGIPFRAGTSNWGTQVLNPWNEIGGVYLDDPFIVDFSVPISSAMVGMGDSGGDMDYLSLEAYSEPGGTGTLLASDSAVLTPVGSQFSFLTLSVEAASIRSLAMVGGSYDYPNSVVYDNLTVTPIPEPATLVVLGTGAAGLLLCVRRRRRNG